jgi:hypothetical protein
MSDAAGPVSGRKLAELWSGAMIFAPHLAGCSCAGFHVPLDPAAVEEDLLDFLAYRYKGEGLSTLSNFVTARNAARSSHFGAWLESLDSAPLENADRERLIGDLFNTLDSMNGARGARSGFVCY